MTTRLALIAAIARDGAIGQNGGLPWGRLEGDMRWFKAITTAADPDRMAEAVCTGSATDGQPPTVNALIMGWRTHRSLPQMLSGRRTIVLRDQTSHGAGDWPCKARTFQEALDKAEQLHAPHTFVCGGTTVYSAALFCPALVRLYVCEIDAVYPDADVGFPWTDILDRQRGLFEHPVWHAGTSRVFQMRRWTRTHVSPWLTEPEKPPYRFGAWGPQP